MEIARPQGLPLEVGCVPPVFQDRGHGGRLLANHLSSRLVEGFDVAIVIERGGRPVHAEIERLVPAFALQTILVTAQRVFHPDEPTRAIGAVTADATWLHPDLLGLFPLGRDAIESAVDRARRRLIARYGSQRRWTEELVHCRPKSLVVIDDVIATGSTMAAVEAGIAAACHPETVDFVAPVGFAAACDLLRGTSRRVYTLVEAPRAEAFCGRSYFGDLIDAKDD